MTKTESSWAALPVSVINSELFAAIFNSLAITVDHDHDWKIDLSG